jgi:hypothetical protein
MKQTSSLKFQLNWNKISVVAVKVIVIVRNVSLRLFIPGDSAEM